MTVAAPVCVHRSPLGPRARRYRPHPLTPDHQDRPTEPFRVAPLIVIFDVRAATRTLGTGARVAADDAVSIPVGTSEGSPPPFPEPATAAGAAVVLGQFGLWAVGP